MVSAISQFLPLYCIKPSADLLHPQKYPPEVMEKHIPPFRHGNDEHPVNTFWESINDYNSFYFGALYVSEFQQKTMVWFYRNCPLSFLKWRLCRFRPKLKHGCIKKYFKWKGKTNKMTTFIFFKEYRRIYTIERKIRVQSYLWIISLPVWQFNPENPPKQEHVYPVSVFWHEPPFKHGKLEQESDTKIDTRKALCLRSNTLCCYKCY